MNDPKGNVMYSISLQRNRVMTISKSFVDSTENRRENVQLEEISNSYKWLNSDTFTGLWFLVKYGYIGKSNFCFQNFTTRLHSNKYQLKLSFF